MKESRLSGTRSRGRKLYPIHLTAPLFSFCEFGLYLAHSQVFALKIPGTN